MYVDSVFKYCAECVLNELYRVAPKTGYAVNSDICRIQQRGTQKGMFPYRASVASEKKLTLYAEFYYLLTLNEVILQHFLLILREADSTHKIRNNKDFCLFLDFQRGMALSISIP